MPPGARTCPPASFTDSGPGAGTNDTTGGKDKSTTIKMR
jgi:hypothetical protein